MKNDSAYTLTEVLVTLAIGGVLLLLTHTFISRSLQMQRVFNNKAKHSISEIGLCLLFKKPFARDINVLSSSMVVIQYNLCESDTIEIYLDEKTIRKGRKKISLYDIYPKTFQLQKGNIFKLTLICKGKNYDWFFFRSDPVY